jgi:hypothetical protein
MRPQRADHVSTADEIPALIILLALEAVLLHRGSRRLFWATSQATGSRLLAYTLALPGTVIHEGAHLLACLALGVPVGRVRLFWPQRTPEGDVVLGGVSHAQVDPVRQSLISIAPLLLTPPLLALITTILLGGGAIDRLPDSLSGVALWRSILWGYLALSCGQAVFPSPGDHIGWRGALALGVLIVGGLSLLDVLGGRGSVGDVLAAVVGLLALPAAAAGLALAAVGISRRLRGRRR